MRKCSSCGVEVQETYQFCPMCSSPLRCRHCSQWLLGGAAFCAQCGSPVPSASSEQLRRAESQSANEIEFSSTPSRRTLRVRATDEGLASIVGALGPAFGSPAIRAFDLPPKRLGKGGGPDQLPLLAGTDDEDEAKGPVFEEDGRVVETHGDTSGETATLSRMFTSSDDGLRSIDWRFKAKSQRDFVTRATCLFLHANRMLLRREPMPRREV